MSTCTYLWNDYSGMRVTSKRTYICFPRGFFNALSLVRSLAACMHFISTLLSGCSSCSSNKVVVAFFFFRVHSFFLLCLTCSTFPYVIHIRHASYPTLFDISLGMGGEGGAQENMHIIHLSCTRNTNSLATVLIGASIMLSWFSKVDL